MIGKTILHYKILEKLGEGGMGIVYKAEDTNLERTVAIKFLPHHIAARQEEKERFKIEAKAAASLNHPNIAAVYASEEVDDEMFIVMEYIDGLELKQKIDAGPVESDESVEIALQIAGGLKAAHEKGVVHRDIKSSNIMLTKSGQVKIMDFGLAKLKGKTRLTQEAIRLGTAAYMSPEQAQGEDVDHRTDIWSFGIVLYEMLTGKMPFKGEYEQAVIYSILYEEPTPVTTLREGIPLELEDIVRKALAKEPSQRYPDADEMIEAFQEVMMGSEPGISTLETNGLEKWRRTSPVIMAGIIILLAAIVGITAFFIYLGKGELKPTEKPGPGKTSQSKWTNSIAVLPFKDFSPKKDQEYFCDGLTDTIIGKLAKLRELKVISMTSVMKFKNKDRSIKEIGKELKVAHILEGSVSKDKDNIRIQAQLIEVAEDSHIWNETYNRKLESVFKVQDEISLMVVNKLKIKLVGEQKRALTKRYTENIEAYELYLKGRYYWNKRTEKAIKTGIGYFTKAIEKDPNYALAYAGLASSYAIMPYYSDMLKEEANRKGAAAALKALELDEKLGEPHLVLADLEFSNYNWPGIENGYKHAIELNSNNATAHQWYAEFLTNMGRFDEAFKEIHRARELDPLSLIISTVEGHILYSSRRYDRAITQLNKTIDMDSNFYLAHLYLGQAYLGKKMYKEAIAVMERAKILSGGTVEVIGYLGYVYVISGRQDRAEKLLRELADRSKQSVKSFYFMALISSGHEKKDQVFKWLNKCYEARVFYLCHLKVDPVWDDIRTDPRFTALLKKMKLE